MKLNAAFLRRNVCLSVWMLGVAATLLSVAGCSGGGISGVYPVRGTVTQKGQPVDGATISFIGEGETLPATAVSKSDGSFEVITQGTPGAFPGNYKVLVTKFEAGVMEDHPGFSATGQDLSMERAAVAAQKPAPKIKELLPVKYSSPATTPLTFEVKSSGENVCELKLD